MTKLGWNDDRGVQEEGGRGQMRQTLQAGETLGLERRGRRQGESVMLILLLSQESSLDGGSDL